MMAEVLIFFEKLKNNSFLKVASGDLLSKVFMVAVQFFIINKLSVAQYSNFSVILASIMLGYQVSCAPIERIYITQFSRYENKILLLGFLFSGVSAFFSVAWLWGSITANECFVIFFAICTLSYQQLLRIKAQQKMFFFLFSFSEVIKNCIWLALVFLLVSFGFDEPVVLIAALIVATLPSILCFKEVGENKVVWNLSGVVDDFLNVKYILLYSLIGSIIPYLPLIMSKSDYSSTVVATYGVAMRYQAILSMGAYAFNVVFVAKLASMDLEQRKSAIKKIYAFSPLLLIAYFTISSGVYLISPVVDGARYLYAQNVFLLLSVIPLVSVVGSVYINFLLLANLTRLVFYCFFVGFFVNFASYFLIKNIGGLYSPALASVCAYSTITLLIVICYYFSNKTRREN
ncbi:hypothetical protein HQ393_01400 [Chitinibacter bivalviorum]|uniref:Oligosaccharide flippase family protein n=1 Tax=Chitinibacter bivalviorum TaxID=2739434 RepID=A0A7H9BF07_9NEIS|nr:hypothetical protein [Chitinibacter bivalviorum]QLG87002.1 hypothetical protein HQ393_01400 [Chitinibacter bivalviorum]